MPQWGIEPHERASFVGWRPSFWPPSANAPCNLALLQNLWFPVGADSISARAISRNHPTARRGQDSSLRTDVNIIQRPKLQSRKIPGASGTSPPTSNHASGVGANIVRPCSFAAAQDCTGRRGRRPLRPTRKLASAPTKWVIEFILAPEGSIGRGRKGVKKNAALLHFLAFAFSDHTFGVPRGRAPWAGPPALSEVAGPFSVPFGVPKGTHSG